MRRSMWCLVSIDTSVFVGFQIARERDMSFRHSIGLFFFFRSFRSFATRVQLLFCLTSLVDYVVLAYPQLNSIINATFIYVIISTTTQCCCPLMSSSSAFFIGSNSKTPRTISWACKFFYHICFFFVLRALVLVKTSY